MKWKKVVLFKDKVPIKVYVNHFDTKAIIFPLFGKYFSISSDMSALDLTVQIIFHKFEDSTIAQYGQYIRSTEDTALIFKEVA